jgi:hypothetical protein
VVSTLLPALIGSANLRLQPVALNASNRFRCRSRAGIAEDHRYCRWDTVLQRHRSRTHPRPPMKADIAKRDLSAPARPLHCTYFQEAS